MSELEDAIRAWERAKVAADDAQMARAAVFEAKAREVEAHRAVVRLMPPSITVGEEMPFDGAEGYTVDGRVYYRVADAIHWMKVANDPQAAATPCTPA